MMHVAPGDQQLFQVDNRAAELQLKADILEQLMHMLRNQTTISSVLVHNKTKTAQVTLHVHRGQLHVTVKDPEEDYRFQFKGNHDDQKENTDGKEEVPSKTEELG